MDETWVEPGKHLVKKVGQLCHRRRHHRQTNFHLMVREYKQTIKSMCLQNIPLFTKLYCMLLGVIINLATLITVSTSATPADVESLMYPSSRRNTEIQNKLKKCMSLR